MSLQLEYGNNDRELSGRHCKITLSALRLFPVLRIALTFSLANIFTPKRFADLSNALTISDKPSNVMAYSKHTKRC